MQCEEKNGGIYQNDTSYSIFGTITHNPNFEVNARHLVSSDRARFRPLTSDSNRSCWIIRLGIKMAIIENVFWHFFIHAWPCVNLHKYVARRYALFLATSAARILKFSRVALKASFLALSRRWIRACLSPFRPCGDYCVTHNRVR